MDYKERCDFLEKQIKRLNAIGLALTTENDTNKIFEMILEEATMARWRRAGDAPNLEDKVLDGDHQGLAKQ